jgi:hypothetical protein
MTVEKFKNDSGKFLLRGMFYERVGADKTGVLYSLKDQDHQGFPSLKRLYLETGDLTEYEFVKNYMASVEHWDDLCACIWFEPLIKEWRRELFLRIQSEALKNIIAESKRDGATKLQANKYLLERGWEPKTATVNKRGRPSKAAIQEAAEDLFTDEKRLQDDYERLMKGEITPNG